MLVSAILEELQIAEPNQCDPPKKLRCDTHMNEFG